MGKEGIRYACKVDLDKDAAEQPYLHVGGLQSTLIGIKADQDRTDGTQTVSSSA